MTKRIVAGLILTVWAFGLAPCPAAEDASSPPSADAPIQYLPLDAPAGMSQAVVVQGRPLVHTRQLLPLDGAGQLVGEGVIDRQVEQVLDNLEAVLTAAGSGLKQLVRLNVYALAPATVDRVRELLAKRLDPSVRPALTAVLTPLPHRDARVAVDAVAVAADQGAAVALQRCETVARDQSCADAAVLPPGGVAYLSGMPAEGGLSQSAVDKSMSNLAKMLGQLKLTPADVVQVKVFLRPATAAADVRRELQKYFPGQSTPPLVFVEWLAQPPVEIELIAHWPGVGEPRQGVRYYNPPELGLSPTFSRVALVDSPRQIYVSSLFARTASRGDDQARDVFAQLETVLGEAGSDLRHLVKATYYVSDDDAARGIDRARYRLFDPQRPPATSKLMTHGVGQAGRTLTLDMIAVGSGP